MPTAPKTAATLSRWMGVLAALAPALAWAADAPVPNKGDTAWMLTSTAFVLLMSVRPGLHGRLGQGHERLPRHLEAIRHSAGGGVLGIRVDRRRGLHRLLHREAVGRSAGRRGRGARGARHHLP